MSKARLFIDGGDDNGYRLLNLSYSLTRETDFSGRPNSDVQGGKIEFQIESREETPFLEWICMKTQMLNGKVEFSKRDSDALLKTLEFTDGYLVEFQEHFENVGDTPMTITGTISAREIVMGNASLTNEWPS